MFTLEKKVETANRWARELDAMMECDEALRWAWGKLVDEIEAEMGYEWVVENLYCVENW